MNNSVLAVILVLVILISIVTNVSFAQSENFENEEAEKYKVGIELTNIGTIDRKSGSYELIFWVTIVSDDVDLTNFPPPDEWDFTNGFIEEVVGVSTEPNFHKFKVRGTFYNQVDFSDYPFETMDLDIHMEPFYPLTTDKLVFEANEEFTGKVLGETVSIPGWEVSSIKIDTYTESYPWGEFAHLEVSFSAAVNPASAFIKKLLPVVILIGVSYSSLWLTFTRLGERTAFTVGALIAAMLFHRVLLNEIPPIGYLTTADITMITAYTLFLLSFITVVIHARRREIYKEDYTFDKAKKLDKKMRILTPLISVGVFVILKVYSLFLLI